MEKLRLECAKRLLEDSGESLELISRQCGFSGVDNMRKIFLRNFKTTPFEYRNLFGRI
ncbi:hypothetical protein DRW42_13365 [Pedobacter miscanthi]|uniref:HTH araC/xylS-type domain-containing protein n=1 Tax=Pedobacter miscanthi TaxID=2259170 RepID=A0A366KZU2_9SPHI|nr:hypothetical protein DRW42_13365 [Pedobacter miscanthi]